MKPFRFTVIAALLGAMALIPALGEAQQLSPAVRAHREMIVTANPQATEAGAFILRIGGTATDAMIATQAVLGLVEPQASGLGGGAFALYYDARSRTVTSFDGREKAPAAATENRFLTGDGKPLDFVAAWQSGLAVGVPGVPRLLEVMHRRYGRLPWWSLFGPAIFMAQGGFQLTENTSDQVGGLLALNPSCADGERLFFRDRTAFEYFANAADCTAKPAGTWVRNPDYANTLRLIAFWGAAGFYGGPVAADLVAAVRGDPAIPGDMALGDLSAYQVIERKPVCIDYRGHKVCSMGPPSSGGLGVGQMLGILEHFDLGSDPLESGAVHLFTQAGRLAFADRNQYVADPGFVPVPVQGMLDKTYLAGRAALIGDRDLGTVGPGAPPGAVGLAAPDRTANASGTSHISIVDRYGNALAMTTTVESSFGNGVMVPGRGFLLNNQLTDFSFAPRGDGGRPVANRVEANKRPRSSMAPTLVFDARGRLEWLTGSPGGSRIIGYVAQSLVNVIDFGLDPQEAIDVPHYMNRNGRTELERPVPGVTVDYDAEALARVLAARGHGVDFVEQVSGLGVIQAIGGGFLGGADRRRDGAVGGQ